MLEAAVIGFASGPACLAACGPVIVPWLAASPGPLRASAGRLGWFLLGRWLGYLGFAVTLFVLSSSLSLSSSSRAIVQATAYLGLAVLLFLLAVRRPLGQARENLVPTIGRGPRPTPPLLPLGFGLLTGLNLCPPFLVVSAGALAARSLLGVVGFFAAFFVGTSLWFLPSLGIVTLSRFEAARRIARLAGGVVASYYAYIGVILLTREMFHG